MGEMFQVMELKGVAAGMWGWVPIAAFVTKAEAETFISARGPKGGLAIWQIPAELVG